MKKYYSSLYTEMRNYIWDFPTVECLAELEIAVYRRFPDISEIRNRFSRLYSCISRTCADDEYLSEASENFKRIINSDDTFFSRIVVPKEA